MQALVQSRQLLLGGAAEELCPGVMALHHASDNVRPYRVAEAFDDLSRKTSASHEVEGASGDVSQVARDATPIEHARPFAELERACGAPAGNRVELAVRSR